MSYNLVLIINVLGWRNREKYFPLSPQKNPAVFTVGFFISGLSSSLEKARNEKEQLCANKAGFF